MVNWASNRMRIKRQSIVTHSFSRKSWYSWKFPNFPVIMACTRSLIHSIWRTIEWNRHLDGVHWAEIHDTHCCCHANHNRPHSHCTWKPKPNATNGWRPSKEPCKRTIEIGLFFFSFWNNDGPSRKPFHYGFTSIEFRFLFAGTIWNQSVVEIPITNSSWQHSMRWQCADIVRNSLRVSFTKATSAKYAKFRCIRDAYHRRVAVNRRPLHHPFVIANCPNSIGLLGRCCVKRRPRNWRIVKLAPICCVFGHKARPIQMKRCMR